MRAGLSAADDQPSGIATPARHNGPVAAWPHGRSVGWHVVPTPTHCQAEILVGLLAALAIEHGLEFNSIDGAFVISMG
jgi:hypothetical protein